MLMGGGFGRRGHRDEEYVHDAVVLSNAVKKPVKVMWTREDDVHNGRFNPLSAHYLRAGFDASGKLVAFHHRKACDEVTAFQDPVRFERQKGRDGIAFNGLDAPYYEIPNRLGEAVPRESGLRTSSLRGIAHLTNVFAIELFMDELARKRGIDPAAFRRELVKSNPRAAIAIIDTRRRMADWGRKRDGSALGFTYMNYSGTQIALAAGGRRSTARPARCGSRRCGRRSTRHRGAARQHRRADREQHHLRARVRAVRAHHDRRRRGRRSRISTTTTCRA